MDYAYESKPFRHQSKLFDDTRELATYGVFWEQGCGKTKPMIDTAAFQFEAGLIDALLVIAPNGVHRNWITDEIPAHYPKRLLPATRMMFWQTGRSGTKWHARDAEALYKHPGMAILTMSYSGFMSKDGKAFAGRFMRRRRAMMVVDEGHNIKTPGIKTTRTVITAGNYATTKRLLTGTPVTKGPFDLYSQVRFLDPGFWKRKGIETFAAFKTEFGIWRTAEEVKKEQGYDPGYDQLLGYKNVETLAGWLKEIGHRLTKDDAGLDLPPKLYSKRYVEITAAQRRAYDDLRDEFFTELADGTLIEAPLAIVRLLRFQQVVCGYLPSDEGVFLPLGEKNPRLEVAEDVTSGLSHPAIIWARFTQDIDQLMDMLGKSAVRYDGTLDDDKKARSKEAFQKGDAQFFVGNQAAGATGLTLVQAKTVMYYSNSFRFVDRLQSEDRAHRIGQDMPVNYIDLIAQDTVDEAIVRNLRGKFDIASQLTGDRLKEWI